LPPVGGARGAVGLFEGAETKNRGGVPYVREAAHPEDRGPASERIAAANLVASVHP